MRKRWSGLLLCLMLAGCTRRTAKDEFPHTILPYHQDDEFYDYIYKTLVNAPVWTIETALAAAFFAAVLWIQVGAPGIRR